MMMLKMMIMMMMILLTTTTIIIIRRRRIHVLKNIYFSKCNGPYYPQMLMVSLLKLNTPVAIVV